MAIRIVRNEAGNCINFYGSSNPTYWNACLSGEVDATDPNAVNVINDIITSETGITQYEFYRIPYTEFVDAEGNSFSTAQEAADYITTKANIIGLSGEGVDLIGESVCFHLDATSTSILLDNGYAYGVNTIKAVEENGNISIISVDTSGSITHFYNLEVGNACVNDEVVPGGLNDVINVLNELFTVGAFESVVISDPFSTMVADVNGVDIVSPTYIGNAIDPVGVDVFGASSSGSLNGYLSTETIDQAGEYFTFDIRVEGTIGFGLVHSQASYDAGYYSGNSSYADPTTFGTVNSQHSGFQFSHWFHPTPNGSWTNYGANTSYSMKSGWSNFNGTDEQADWLAGNPIKVRVGLDANGFISVETLRNGTDWVVHVRTSYASVEGVEYRLGIKMGDTSVRLNTLPKVHLLEPAAPTMYFRYIESPDGNFHYPLFATEEEANYYDTINGGSGQNVPNIFPDDATNTTWYEPVNGYTHNGTSAPSGGTFEGNAINWTEITSLSNADLVPPAYTSATITVDELSSVNIQLQPADTSYTTSVTDNDGAGLILIGSNLEGSSPEVLNDNVANPSDTYTFTVTRTNSYGSSTGTLTLVVNNLTAPVTTISGFNHITGTTSMIDSDTMDDGSAVHVNTTVADGERFVIEQAYIEANILPNLTATNDMYAIGLGNVPETFGDGVALSDFDAAIVWEYESSTSHTFKFYRDGSVVQNIVINSLTDAFYDYAIEINGTSAWLIACNVNSIMNEPSPADGGNFSHTYEVTSIEDSAPVTIHMAALNTTGDISTTDIETITTPSAPVSNLTSWSKALDFSGSSERAQPVSSSTSASPLKMAGTNNQVSAPTTSGNTTNGGHPFATAIVFTIDGNSSNQHIWNLGEGAGSTDDNIYLRVDANRGLYFGWGRQGDLNELFFGSLNVGTWYGCYIGHNGTRYGSGNTAAQLADAFDVRLYSDATNWQSASAPNSSTPTMWGLSQSTVGGRMNREYQGYFTVGGRGANRNFHGKVASMVVTTLKCNVAMPDTTEIEMMIKDPIKWIQDYKEGNTFRQPLHTTTNTSWDSSVGTTKAFATQVWLMGDGVSDSYSNMIRNQVFPNDQNYTKLNLISMVSNDIENVTIPGLI